jgi:hypothetical protein
MIGVGRGGLIRLNPGKAIFCPDKVDLSGLHLASPKISKNRPDLYGSYLDYFSPKNVQDQQDQV